MDLNFKVVKKTTTATSSKNQYRYQIDENYEVSDKPLVVVSRRYVNGQVFKLEDHEYWNGMTFGFSNTPMNLTTYENAQAIVIADSAVVPIRATVAPQKEW
jgi:regulatory protein YycI of two-component signal transduction system YycFG